MINIPTLEESRAILEAAYPQMVITDAMVERGRYRIALNLEPLSTGNNDIQERMLKKMINHENRLDEDRERLIDHEARLAALEA